MVLGDIPVNNARHFPDRVGIVDPQARTRFTWRKFNERVNRLANAILGMDVKRGDRVAIVSENSFQCAEFQFAVAKAGVIGCPLNYRLHPKQLETILLSAEPRVLFVQAPFADLIRSIGPGVKGIEHFVGLDPHLPFPLEYEPLVQSSPASEPEVEVKEDDGVMITYSSGTTGLPKGILSTHRNRMTYCIESSLFAERFEPDDVALDSAPFCAGVGGQVQLMAPAFAGCTVVMYVLRGSTWAEVVERERVTVILTTKSRMMPVWDFLKTAPRRYDFSSLKKVTTAGQAHSEKDLRELMEFCGVSYCAKMYGLSETVATGTRLLSHEVAAGLQPGASEKEKRRLESVGKPLLSTRVKVVNEEGKEVPPGELGEIIMRGDAVSPGYWKNPQLNAKTFRDGWMYTKDIGLLDEDGYLYIKGRKDFMIKSGGFMIPPAEVEQALLKHPAVDQAAVIGVPDARWGEAAKGILVLKEGAKVTAEELKAHCQQFLARFQVPKDFEFVAKLPRDDAGRVQLKEVLRLYGRPE